MIQEDEHEIEEEDGPACLQRYKNVDYSFLDGFCVIITLY